MKKFLALALALVMTLALAACGGGDGQKDGGAASGAIKIGGNYAASLNAGQKAHELGYSVMLYLDPKENKYLDECGAANFFGVKGNTYVTPNSRTVLPSITNKSLRTLAEDLGLKVEQREIPYEELSEFSETGTCGTAAVCTGIGQIDDLDKGTSFVYGMEEAGPVTTKLYHALQDIQYGDAPDTHGWCEIIELD